MTPRPFQFFSGDTPLAVTVHRAAEQLMEPGPTVLVTGSWLTVREQMPDRYAAALAERGYTAITFDFAGFGGSGGSPRQAEVCARKVADIAAAARAVRGLSFVRPGAVGHLAVCASAQYALRAIAEGAPIDSFAAVAGWFHDAATVAPFYGGGAGVGERLRRAGEALETYQRTGEVVTVPAYQAGNDRAGMFLEMDYYANPSRGAVATWTNQMAELSWLHWLTFDGLTPAAGVSVPTLLVHADDCVLPDNAREVARRMGGQCELVWAEGGQTDFYDQEKQVTMAIDAVDRHFRATLAR